MTKPNTPKRQAIEGGVEGIIRILPELHAKSPEEATRIANETLEDIRETGNLDLEPALLKVIQDLDIQVEEIMEKPLTPQRIAEALRNLLEDDEFADIASSEDIQDAMGAAYAILLSKGEDPDAILVKRGITEPE